MLISQSTKIKGNSVLRNSWSTRFPLFFNFFSFYIIFISAFIYLYFSPKILKQFQLSMIEILPRVHATRDRFKWKTKLIINVYTSQILISIIITSRLKSFYKYCPNYHHIHNQLIITYWNLILQKYKKNMIKNRFMKKKDLKGKTHFTK